MEQDQQQPGPRERLLAYRTSRGLSLKGLAAELGTSASNLSMIERGRRPGIKTAAAIEDLIGINLRDWLRADHAA